MSRSKDTYPGIIHHLGIPLLIVVAMWAVFLVEFELGANFAPYGLYPRTSKGLVGIFTIPFIHGSWSHILNNSVPMLILGWALFKFYNSVAIKTLLGIYIISGIWLWISGRPSFHIGASGIVYGLAAFLFLSGWIRKEKKVAALSLLVAFLYGGFWWGVLPVDPTISWEGHLWGAVSGFSLALLYRKQGPAKPKYQWEIDEENEIASMENHTGDENNSVYVNYTFIPNPVEDKTSSDNKSEND